MSKTSSVTDKLKKHAILMECSFVSMHLLDTVGYSKSNFLDYIEKYKYLYLKPTTGSLGKGVIAVTFNSAKYNIYHKDKVYNFNSSKAAMNFLKDFTHSRSYLIQEGLKVLKFQSKQTDLRVVCQRPYFSWEVGGISVRVGRPNSVISNYSAGGSVISLEEYLRANGISDDRITDVKTRVVNLCERSAIILEKALPDCRTLGFDIGIGKDLKPWIIEVNTAPRFNSFKKLDMDVYNQIKAKREIIKGKKKNRHLPKKKSPLRRHRIP